MLNEYTLDGILGILLFSLIIGIAVYLFHQEMNGGGPSLTKQLFLTMLILMSLMEMPRYYALAVTGNYDSQGAYSCHILAGVFFFAAFSMLCKQWCEILQAGDTASRSTILVVFYGKQGLIISNVVFIIDDIITLGICLSSASLDDFFHSSDFYVYTLLEGFRNIFYSALLLYYGVVLAYRLGNIDSSIRGVGRFWDYIQSLRDDSSDHVLALKVFRISAVLALCTACFFLRASMLIIKLATLDYSTNLSFSTFGVVWFTLADFIPRVVPCLALMFMVRTTTKRPPNAADGQSLASEDREDSMSGGESLGMAEHNDRDKEMSVDEEESSVGDLIRGLGRYPSSGSKSNSISERYGGNRASSNVTVYVETLNKLHDQK